jgi:hypothetical protein
MLYLDLRKSYILRQPYCFRSQKTIYSETTILYYDLRKHYILRQPSGIEISENHISDKTK